VGVTRSGLRETLCTMVSGAGVFAVLKGKGFFVLAWPPDEEGSQSRSLCERWLALL
jgi:hypothetical protein